VNGEPMIETLLVEHASRSRESKVRRVGVFGWGIVAPRSRDIASFERNLASGESWLTPFRGFGRSNFLVGEPDFQFDEYRAWIDKRFPARHFKNLKEKMDFPSLYAIGAFIQSLSKNPQLERILQELGSQAHIYIGTGLGAVDTMYQSSISLFLAQQRWNRFWSRKDKNSALRAFVEGKMASQEDMPAAPETIVGDATEATLAWEAYWAARSPELQQYLDEASEIDAILAEGDVEQAKLQVLWEKNKRHARLSERWGSPTPPWSVSANLIWNIHNTPAAQVSILGRITGLTFAPVAACSTFGVALHLAMRAIRNGDAKAVVVGATDPPPHPLVVGSFLGAKVLSSAREASIPLTRLAGTHIAGGAVVWIIGDMEYLQSMGCEPIGMEPLAVGVSSDANHIITPSVSGPQQAIQQALEEAHAGPDQVGTWDLHATATPGDYSEVSTLRTKLPEGVMVTARKGTFGHGMSAGSGWELTAQYLGYMQGRLFPTPLTRDALHPSIAAIHRQFVFSDGVALPDGLAGKLSSGVGGVNACVVSRPLV
jgi:3-oxoacyl-[acyl-carrier-protein] synthase II